MKLDLDWEPPLRGRRGARTRLGGIRVFYDFDWVKIFEHNRSTFLRGQILAQTVKAQCPTGLKPALLLTQRTDVEQGFRSTDSHFLYVVNIDEWLATPENAALAYAHSHLPVNPSDVRKFVESQLDIQHVAEWVAADPDRRRQLADLLGHDAGEGETVQDALNAIAALGELEERDIEKVVEFVMAITDGDRQVELLRGVTKHEPGRRVAATVLQERTADRITDARKDLSDYEELLNEQSANETDMQTFLAAHPLLFGLEYANIRPQASGPSGSMDFILEGLDGYNDVVELKGPGESIVSSQTRAAGAGSPSPHAYKFGKAVAQALAQAMAYRDRLTRHSGAATELHGIANPREPRLLVVVGRRSDMADHEFQVLQELNKSLHRASVIPYDLIAVRARQALDNIEVYLGLEGS